MSDRRRRVLAWPWSAGSMKEAFVNVLFHTFMVFVLATLWVRDVGPIAIVGTGLFAICVVADLVRLTQLRRDRLRASLTGR